MNNLEFFFLNLGMSWTAAKILPYLFFLLIGLIVSYYFFRKTTKKKKLFLATPIALLPIIIYFILHPIYEGDFSNSSYISKEKIVKELKKDELVVIAIPGCPYCLESANKLNLLKSRNPEMNIRFLVCTSNYKDLSEYKKAFNKSIPVDKTIETEIILGIAKDGFPTFLTIRNGIIQKAWSNDSFGVRAMDEIEREY